MRGVKEFRGVFFFMIVALLSSGGCERREEGGTSQAEDSQTSTRDVGTAEMDHRAPERTKKVGSLDDVLGCWDRGDKDGAAEGFLAIPWSDPTALACISAIGLSETEFQSLSKSERDRVMKEYQDVRTKLLVGVVRHVRSAGDAALATGDRQKARACYDAIARCGHALSSADRLALLRLDGEAISKMAQDRLSSLE